jgi:hypothetical protein
MMRYTAALKRWLHRSWQRFADWLGLDRAEPVDLLTSDPARHFREWDRDLPHRHYG